MSDPIFDAAVRRLRRDRAARMKGDPFLAERAFADILDRLSLVRRRFRSALLVGCPVADWPRRLGQAAEQVQATDAGPLYAARASGIATDEEAITLSPGSVDLVVAIGALDHAADLPAALARLRTAMEPDALLVGAIVGGDSLPMLRGAMRAADEAMGSASPHVHPRIAAQSLAGLLSGCGFVMPVIDVDAVQVAYRGLDRLVRDLRAMACTNILSGRSRRPLSRAARAAARDWFALQARTDGRTVERFELLHFAAWTPARPADTGHN